MSVAVVSETTSGRTTRFAKRSLMKASMSSRSTQLNQLRAGCALAPHAAARCGRPADLREPEPRIFRHLPLSFRLDARRPRPARRILLLRFSRKLAFGSIPATALSTIGAITAGAALVFAVFLLISDSWTMSSHDLSPRGPLADRGIRDLTVDGA